MTELQEEVDALEALADAEEALALIEAQQAQRDSLLALVEGLNPRYRAGWVHRDICDRLKAFSDAAARGESPRLILCMPPRHGKSEIVSRRLPVWHLGRNPTHEVVVASYGAALAEELSASAREATREAANVWPHLRPKRGGKWTNARWETSGGGSVAAVGVGGPLTGRGAHLLVIDDPIKDAEEAASPTIRDKIWAWYTSTAYTRLAPGGGALVMMTRWHEDDLVGKLLQEQKQGGDAWEVINFPAIAEADEYSSDGQLRRRAGEALHPARYPLARLQKIKVVLGPYRWGALYQQRPTAAEGSIFQRDWFLQRYDCSPHQLDLREIAITVDATFKDSAGTDYVVIQVWGRSGTRFYLLDQVRARMNYPTLRQSLRDVCAAWPHATLKLIEDKANGPALIADLTAEIEGMTPYNPRASKAERAQIASVPLYAAGNIWLPSARIAPWIGDFIEEHIGFGAGAAHDDQVDAESQMLLWWGQWGDLGVS